MITGDTMYGWLRDLYPINRSLTGDGVRQTLRYLQGLVPDLQIHEVPSGTKAFDWEVPDEWNVREAHIEDESGNRVVDFLTNNLHLVGYSEPVDAWLDLDDLDSHLFSMPDQPELIPYVTSYYKRRWGFCMAHRQREALTAGRYHAVIRATLQPGSLTYGELILPGRQSTEVLLSTYICHPSMANNELSGPVVTTALAKWLSSMESREHTYRIIFVPETIGSIVYLSRHLEVMKQRTIAGYVVTCIGDDRCYSLLTSPKADTLADRVAHHVMTSQEPGFKQYSFLERGSDERQYCSPGVELPVASVMRSKYGTYPEYHTSADNLDLVSPSGLMGGYAILRGCLNVIEHHGYYCRTGPCEPQLGKRGLYPTISAKGSASSVKDMMNLMAFCDGRRDLVDLAEAANVNALEALPILATLMEHGLVERLPLAGCIVPDNATT